MKTVAKHQKQLTAALHHFYQQPIAKVSIELILSIGLVLFLAVFAIRPTLVTMSNLIKEIEDKSQLNEQLQKKVAALSTAQTEYLSFEHKLPILDQAVPSRPDLVYNLKLLEKLAADNRVIISGMTIAELPPDESLTEVPFSSRSLNNIPVSLNLVGDYPSIRSFIESLRDNRRAMTVESISFSLNRNRSITNLRTSITISIPYYGSTASKATPGKQSTPRPQQSNSATDL